MSPLQRFLIIRRHGNGTLDIIGTNSGQAFVERAAERQAQRLTNEVGGSFSVHEICKVGPYMGGDIEHVVPPTEES